MGILFHRACGTGKVIAVEICRNVFKVPTPKIVSEAHEGVKLVLSQLSKYGQPRPHISGTSLEGRLGYCRSYSNIDIFVDAKDKRGGIGLEQILALGFGNGSVDIVTFRIGLTSMTIADRLNSLQTING